MVCVATAKLNLKWPSDGKKPQDMTKVKLAEMKQKKQPLEQLNISSEITYRNWKKWTRNI